MQTIDAPISEVTVYTDRARIRRSGSVELKSGERSLIVSGISRKINMETLAVSIPGVQLISVNPIAKYALSLSEAETKRIQEELQEAEKFAQNLRIERNLLEQEFIQIKILAETVNAHLGVALINGTKSLQDAANLRAGLQASFRNTEIQKRQYEEQEATVKGQIEQLKKSLSSNSRSIIHYDLQIQVRVKKALKAEALISYFVTDVSWQAQYQLELKPDHVELDYAATIRQDTGENWPKIVLTLSTADFNQKPEIPRAKFWEINKLDEKSINSEVRERQSRLLQETMPLTQAGHSITMKRLPLKETGEQAAREVEAEMAQKEQSETHGIAAIESFRTKEAVTVAGNNEIVHTRLAILKLPAYFDFVTVPKVSWQIIHRAKIINDSNYTLIPAAVLILENGMVVSRTQMKRTAPNEEIEFPLRIEEHIKVRRRMAERSTMQMNDNLRRIYYRFVITLENYRGEKSLVTLRDTIPNSLNEEISVRFLESTPPIFEMGERGVLKWVIELAPKSRTEVEFSFEIDSPKTTFLSGIL